MANTPQSENDLVDAAVVWLTESLPDSWETSRTQRGVAVAGDRVPRTLDAAIDIRANTGTYTTLAVEARSTFSPAGR